MDITQIFLGIIMILGGTVTAFVVPVLRTKLNATQLEIVQMLVSQGVRAAEQIITGTGKGVEKKQFVVEYLAERGYTVDTENIKDALNMQIEAAVKDLRLEEK